MSITVKKNERQLILFFVKLFLIWLSWKGIVFILGEAKMPLSERMFPSLSEKWEAVNYSMVRFLVVKSQEVLSLIGFEAYCNDRTVWIAGANGIAVGNYCIGIQLMYYYAVLILITPMSALRKTAGVLTGIAITIILNIARIAGLCLVTLYAPRYLFLAHDHIFNIIVFGTLIGFYYYISKTTSAYPEPALPKTAAG